MPPLAMIGAVVLGVLADAASAEPDLRLYHGGQRWTGSAEIRPHRRGEAEHGPGIYLTTSWETARRYARGGGAVYEVALRPPRLWLEDARLSLADAESVVAEILGRGRRLERVLASLRSASGRSPDGSLPACVLLNSFVNSDPASGGTGRDLASALARRGIGASLVHQSGEDWVVVLDPSLVRRVRRLAPKDVDAAGFEFDLPRLHLARRTPAAGD